MGAPAAKKARVHFAAALADAESLVVEIQDDETMEVLDGAERKVLMALDSVIAEDPDLDWSAAVLGPCTKAVRATLATTPAAQGLATPFDEETAAQRKALEDAEDELTIAQEDVDGSVGLSKKFQEVAARALCSAEALVSTLTVKLANANSSTVDLSTLGFTVLDKRRANAEDLHNAWSKRCAKKRESVGAEVAAALAAIKAAQMTLQLQHDDIADCLTKHTALWELEQNRVDAGHQARIEELRLLCQQAKPSVSSPTVSQEVQDLKQIVEDLKQQLHKAQGLLSLGATASVALSPPPPAPALAVLPAVPPPSESTALSAEEVQQRIAHVAAVKLDLAPKSADGASAGGVLGKVGDAIKAADGVLA